MELLRMILVALLSLSFILFPVAQAAELALPSGDLVAPVIKHTPINEGIYSGQSVNIKATVTDNMGVKSVILFYRDANAAEFKRLQMNRDLDSFVYTAQPTVTHSSGLEYYIQATDLAGNTLLFGYSFSPLTIAGIAAVNNTAATDNNSKTTATQAVAVANTAKTEEKESGISKWVWIGLGVVIAGAALSSSGGGDNDSDPPAATGNLTLSGPTP